MDQQEALALVSYATLIEPRLGGRTDEDLAALAAVWQDILHDVRALYARAWLDRYWRDEHFEVAKPQMIRAAWDKDHAEPWPPPVSGSRPIPFSGTVVRDTGRWRNQIGPADGSPR
jgi:hypothetical protein